MTDIFFKSDDALSDYRVTEAGEVWLFRRDDADTYLHAKLDDKATRIMFALHAHPDFTDGNKAKLGRVIYAHDKFVNWQ